MKRSWVQRNDLYRTFTVVFISAYSDSQAKPAFATICGSYLQANFINSGLCKFMQYRNIAGCYDGRSVVKIPLSFYYLIPGCYHTKVAVKTVFGGGHTFEAKAGLAFW